MKPGANEEVELKAGVDAEALAQLRRLPLLREATIGRPRSQLLVSVYYDAADLRLATAGLFLRTRRVGRSWEQTVKAARRAPRGLQRVIEITDPAPGPQPDLARVSSAAIRKTLTDTLAGAPLRPVFRSEIRRTTRLLHGDDGNIELALDRGCVVAGEERSDFCEVELECVDSDPALAFDWAVRLLGDRPARLLQPSKAARGFALARGESLPSPAPMHANLAGLSRMGSASEALSALFDLYARAISENLYCVMTASDVEGPHQLRVSLRRLRALLEICERGLHWKSGQTLRRQARALGTIVSDLRDADVLVDDIVQPMVSGGSEEAALTELLDARRERSRSTTRIALCSAGATAFALRVLEIAELESWRPEGKKLQRQLAQPLLRVIEPILDRAWKRARRHGRHLERFSDAKRHRLRKDLKQLRYLAEIASLAAEAADSRKFFRRLGQLQDDLGLLNDLATLEQRHLLLDDPAAAKAYSKLLARQRIAESRDPEAVLARAARRWRKLLKAGPFWRASN